MFTNKRLSVITICIQINQLLKSTQTTREEHVCLVLSQKGRESLGVHISTGHSVCSQERIVVNSQKMLFQDHTFTLNIFALLSASPLIGPTIPQCGSSSHSSNYTCRETPRHPLGGHIKGFTLVALASQTKCRR